MSTTDHNKILGIMHLAYGALNLLIMAFMSVFMLGMFGVLASNQQGGAAPMAFVLLILGIVLTINSIFTVPSFLAGYAMLKRKSWAKVAGIIAAAVDALNLPLGTALSVYTFWFLFSEQGRRVYGKEFQGLPPAPPRWDRLGERQGEYAPRVNPLGNPPDWR